MSFIPSAAMRRRVLFMGAFSLLFAGYAVAKTCQAIPKSNTDPASPPDLGYYSLSSNFLSVIGGVEQVDLSSQPSQTEPFARLYFQSAPAGGCAHDQLLAWGSVRLLGAPTPADTQGVFSVFTDPTGQITTAKLSSVGVGTDFMIGTSYRIHVPQDNSTANHYAPAFELILGFGATTPFPSNKVTQAFTAPVFGTTECNILFQKFQKDFTAQGYGIQKSGTGAATGSTTACLLNSNAPTTSNGATTYAPINTIAFSNTDRTSFLLKNVVGARLTLPKNVGDETKANKSQYLLGMIDLTFGMDSSVTGGVFRGNRWIFKTDAIYPLVSKGHATFYLFGSFSTRLEKNVTDNSPLILQAATLATVTGTGSTAVPNVYTVVLPLRQPDRDFYRIGVGIDLTTLIKAASK